MVIAIHDTSIFQGDYIMHPRTGFIDFATLLFRSFFIAMAQAARLRRQGHLFQVDSDDFPLSADAFGFGAAKQAGLKISSRLLRLAKVVE